MNYRPEKGDCISEFVKVKLPKKPFYMLGELNELEIEEVLTDQVIGRIGCSCDGRTYVVPISYTYSDEAIYALTFDGMKMDIMRKNPMVCFQVDIMKDMANWKSVVAWGRFEELKDKEERKRALEILVNRSLPLVSSVTTHLAPTWPFLDKEIDHIQGIVFRIQLEEKTGRFENSQNSSFLR
jgi:uncharacterized protein